MTALKNLPYERSLAYSNPELAEIWHPTKNGNYSLRKATIGANRKIWFLGNCGHEWDALANNYLKGSRECPYCSGKRILPGFNDLQTIHPELAKQWHPTLNINDDITKISPGGVSKIWWQCSKGHEWQARIFARFKNGQGCPYCFGRLPIVGVNDLQTTNPELVTEWHPTKNGNVTPSQIKLGSDFKAYWICLKGHEWQAIISSRKTNNCPYCGNKKVLAGYNDLNTTDPLVAAEWHPTKNILTPQSVTRKSAKVVWWLCDKGHEWEARIFSRHINGCPVCSNWKVVKDVNDLNTTDKDLSSYWNVQKNGSLSSFDVHSGSDKVVWWICDKAHEWEESLYFFKRRRTCPGCSNTRLMKGMNDLLTLKPEIVNQWHPNKNGDLTPSDVMSESTQIVWWLCSKGHEWKSPVKYPSCPNCNNRKLLKGFNDLLTVNPILAAEWHPTLNGNLTSSDVMAGQGIRVWWLCKEGHEWKALLANRNFLNRQCMQCFSNRVVSKPEKEIVEFLAEHNIKFNTSNRKLIHPYELDIYIPEQKIAIEFNGIYWHTESKGKTKEYHYNKWLACQNIGIQLIQVWEDDWITNSDKVKNMLLRRLTLSDDSSLENIKIVKLNDLEALDFLKQDYFTPIKDENIFYLGIQSNNGDLISVIALSYITHNESILSIIGFSSLTHGVSELAKFIDYLRNMYRFNQIDVIIKNDFGLHNVFESNGFIKINSIEPDYSYRMRDIRVSKDYFSLERFVEDPKLVFISGLSAYELSDVNKISRLWDSGKTRLILTTTFH